MSFFKDITIIQHWGNWCIKHRIPVIPKLLSVVKRFIFPACDIPMSVELGQKVEFPHRAIGVVIHGGGENR